MSHRGPAGGEDGGQPGEEEPRLHCWCPAWAATGAGLLLGHLVGVVGVLLLSRPGAEKVVWDKQ